MAIINTSTQNIKNFLRSSWLDQLFWISFVVCVSIISFSVGALYERQQLAKAVPVEISQDKDIQAAWENFARDNQDSAQFYASKNGSKAYPIDCKAGNRINEENKIFFQSLEQAQDLGFELSSRC